MTFNLTLSPRPSFDIQFKQTYDETSSGGLTTGGVALVVFTKATHRLIGEVLAFNAMTAEIELAAMTAPAIAVYTMQTTSRTTAIPNMRGSVAIITDTAEVSTS